MSTVDDHRLAALGRQDAVLRISEAEAEAEAEAPAVVDPDDERMPGTEELERLRAACQCRFRDAQAYTVDLGKICFYTVQPDEHFIAEPIERIWVMAGFSGHGFKFGAVMGRAMAATIHGDITPRQMTDFAAGRIRDPEQLQALTNLCLG